MGTQTQEPCGSLKENLTCTSVSAQYADVGVPIKLRPSATVGNLETECCGAPALSIRPWQGENCSCGCEVIITQTICMRIPVIYDTVADIGEITVNCKKNSNCGFSTL